MNRRNWILTSLLLVATLLLALGPVQAQDGQARLRFLHAVPGAPDVDIYIDGTLAVPGLSYGEVTPHLNIPAGSRQISVREAGSDAAAPALLEVPVPMVSDLAYILVLQGVSETLEPALYEDVLVEIDPGFARLTAINAVKDAPSLDIVNNTGGPLIQGINYGLQFSTANIGTGLQNLAVVPAGGQLDSALGTVGEIGLESNTLYTFVTIGTIDGDVDPSVIALADPVDGAADSVRVRIAHGSPNAGTVDVYANDALIIPSLVPGTMSGHLPLPAGTYTIALRAAGTPATEAPIVSSEVTLDPITPAITVAAVGDALQIFPDSVADVTPDQARFAVINTLTDTPASVSLSEGGITLATDVAAGAQSEAASAAPGDYTLTVTVGGTDITLPAQTYYGGVYYSVLVYSENETPAVALASTVINVTPASFPGASQPTAVAVEPTVEPTAVVVTEAPTQSSEVVQPTESSEVVAATATETPTQSSEVVPPTQSAEVVQPTQSSEVVPTTPAESSEVVQAATPAPLITQSPRPVAYVQLDPGARLHCRELPLPDARSLGMIPSGANLTIVGRPGTPLVPETGAVTPEPTPVIEAIEDMWLSVQWDTQDGGYLRCWVSAQFLRVEYNGRLLDTLEELQELPEEPFNRPGEAVNTTIAPPTPRFDAVLATVELEPGVNLQLRRNPLTSAEQLALVPAGAQLEVLGYIEAPSEGAVGQPTSPVWLRVRYRTENGGATIGWISGQYVSLSRAGRKVELADEVPLLETSEPGYFEDPGTQPVIPIEQQDVVGIVNLNPGANLNLRDRPAGDAFIVRAIPSGELVTINGRNGDGTWVEVTYEADGTEFEGWVATQYLVISQGGQGVDLSQLPNMWTDADVMNGQAPVATETPATVTPNG